jgi:NAD(P)H-nitrite reductase large subunit
MEEPRVVLVGAGFIGFIMLNAMFKRGWNLSVVERESHVLPRMLDATSAGMVESWLGSQGVNVHAGTTVQEIKRGDSDTRVVQLDNGSQIEADIVIIATGIKANLDLIDGSGIETDQGILVNDQMRTNFSNIYAAGDIAQGPVLFGDDRAVHAIQPTAVDHGRVAGANMAGLEVHYPGSLLMNIVDICGLQGASFGAWDDPNAEAMTIANPSGSIYRKLLWREDQLVGAIFTGRPDDMGMLTDVGMVKGILQTQTALGPWKQYLSENPFDIRRAYIGAGVAQKLVGSTLLGRPTKDRKYKFGGTKVETPISPSHATFVGTK